MKEIAKEYQVGWDTTESEKELLKPPEELIEGPTTFVSASNLPVKPSTTAQFMETNKPTSQSSGGVGDQSGNVQFEDFKSAAGAAAESAMKAIAAAEVAAYMAKKEEASQRSIYDDGLNNGPASTIQETMHRSRSLPRFDHINREDKIYRRYSHNPSSAYSDIKFDESDCDEENEMEEEEAHGVLPPNRPPPPVPLSQDGNARVHPKLPDYDELVLHDAVVVLLIFTRNTWNKIM